MADQSMSMVREIERLTDQVDNLMEKIQRLKVEHAEELNRLRGRVCPSGYECPLELYPLVVTDLKGSENST